MSHAIAWSPSIGAPVRCAARCSTPTGAVLEEQSHPRGILTVPAGGFTEVFETLFGEWMRPRARAA